MLNVLNRIGWAVMLAATILLGTPYHYDSLGELVLHPFVTRSWTLWGIVVLAACLGFLAGGSTRYPAPSGRSLGVKNK
jgi:hypothetical protein